MFHKVVVANRGAVAARIIRCLNQLGIRSVAVYSEADAGAPYLAMASEAHPIGAPEPAKSYLNQDALLEAARRSKADALHPGYGFLAENPGFAAHVRDAGLVFIGPQPRWIEAMGHKTRARELMRNHGLPMCASSEVLPDDPAVIVAEARRIGFPVLVKPAAGGGGIGMLPARDADELVKAVERARSLSARSFADAAVYLERLMPQPRHIEVQIVADNHGAVGHLFERDCSVQRRHQKVIEEGPAPGIDRAAMDAVADQAAAILADLGYDNIGTVEMLYDAEAGFSFLEMNTRLQVEHAVTEAITGVDLVATQIALAAGAPLDRALPADVKSAGHAIEARIYAEDPKRFLPSPGPLTVFRPPAGDGIRIETGYVEGGRVTPFYDPMVAKVIASGPDRAEAIRRLRAALAEFAIEGIKCNIPFLLDTLDHDDFLDGRVDTGLTGRVLAAGQRAA